MSTLYNSSPKVHGVFSGGSCKITIERKTNKKSLSAGFLISGFRLSYRRSIQNQYHINTDGVTYMVGEAEGSLSLEGLVGDRDAYKNLLTADETKGSMDVCDPLTITITPNSLATCTSSTGIKPAKFVCQGCVSNGLSLNASSGQGGLIIASGSLDFQFNGLELQ